MSKNPLAMVATRNLPIMSDNELSLQDRKKEISESGSCHQQLMLLSASSAHAGMRKFLKLL